MSILDALLKVMYEREQLDVWGNESDVNTFETHFGTASSCSSEARTIAHAKAAIEFFGRKDNDEL